MSINEVAKNGSNYMPPEEALALTPEGVHKAVYGSTMTFVLEIFTITATWTVKACLLILYARLTWVLLIFPGPVCRRQLTCQQEEHLDGAAHAGQDCGRLLRHHVSSCHLFVHLLLV